MHKILHWYQKSFFIFLSSLAFLANISARLGAGTASAWGFYQPQIPEELKR